MICPLCKETLQISERQGVEIDYCPKCRGVWLDRGELQKLIDLSIAQLAPQAPPPPAQIESGRRYDDDSRYANRYPDPRYEDNYRYENYKYGKPKKT